MKIAIGCADLDHGKIDGTRVYIKNVLDRLGALAPNDYFLLYHQKDFNPLLAPKMHPNYAERKIPYSFVWTQTRFPFELDRDKPDVLWMPIQQIPLVAPKEISSVVTIHDLAWKYFPANFEFANRMKLDFFAQTAIKRADRLIAVSESTKKDILKFYPKTDPRKISVVHHGFDRELFGNNYSNEEASDVLKKYKIVDEKLETVCRPARQGNWNLDDENINFKFQISNFILYVGGLDEKENLSVLIEAFEKIKKIEKNTQSMFCRSAGSFKESEVKSNLKLVLVGNDNENSAKTLAKIANSPNRSDICTTGRIDFDELAVLYQKAEVLVLPSKYEGFGITILEGFASKIPVVATASSSLAEVGGSAVMYFDGEDPQQLAGILQKILKNSTMREEMVRKGSVQAQKFSWEKCARETLAVLKAKS